MSEEPCKAHSRHIKSASSAAHLAPPLHPSWQRFPHSTPSVPSSGSLELCPVDHLQMSGWLAGWRKNKKENKVILKPLTAYDLADYFTESSKLMINNNNTIFYLFEK